MTNHSPTGHLKHFVAVKVLLYRNIYSIVSIKNAGWIKDFSTH